MNQKKKKKRYLVTYADQDIDSSKASSILGVAKSKTKEGVSFMETDSTPKGDDVLHFSKLGISSIELDDEEQSKLAKKKEVLAIEEDIEVHILELTEEEKQMERFSSSLNDAGYDTNGSYQEGYQNAMMDLFSSMLQMGSRSQSSVEGGPTPTFPFPRKPIPRRPLPFPWKPPVLRKQPIPWNISMINAPAAWNRGYKGNGVNVAVLDTGIANHTDLSISGGVSFVNGVSSYDDGNSHGTHCAGIIGARNNFIGVVGVAPLCDLYAVKVLSDSGSGYSSWVIAGMDWCIQNDINVASMSLGSKSSPSVAYANAVRRCQEAGVTVVTSSGNSGNDPNFPWVGSPGNAYQLSNSKASPIAVGAVNQSSTIAGFSSRDGNHDEWNRVTVVAPGVDVNSTVLNNGYDEKTGTSMACPHVAGLAALLYEKFPGISPINVERRITATSIDLGGPGFDEPHGYGLINCDLATA
ncbi:MAG: S8 family serine peptidase [Bacteroidetes bacterium]|jgi:subtilisin|nr:S8 family serine peptidase [Bacteroidota bacterium]